MDRSKTINIGEVADYLGISSDALRLYEKMGIFSVERDPESNYRKFNREDIIFLDYIVNLRDLDIPLEKIKTISRDYSVAEADAALEAQARVIAQRIEELKAKEEMIADYRKTFDQVLKAKPEIEIIKSPVFICRDIKDSSICWALKATWSRQS